MKLVHCLPPCWASLNAVNASIRWSHGHVQQFINRLKMFYFSVFAHCTIKARNVGQAINVKGSGRLSHKNLLSRFEFGICGTGN